MLSVSRGNVTCHGTFVACGVSCSRKALSGVTAHDSADKLRGLSTYRTCTECGQHDAFLVFVLTRSIDTRTSFTISIGLLMAIDVFPGSTPMDIKWWISISTTAHPVTYVKNSL